MASLLALIYLKKIPEPIIIFIAALIGLILEVLNSLELGCESHFELFEAITWLVFQRCGRQVGRGEGLAPPVVIGRRIREDGLAALEVGAFGAKLAEVSDF